MKHGFGRTTLILWLLTAGVVSVASAANWDTDGLNGGIRATGTLVASPCVLLPESAEQEIDLGSTVAWGLERPGSVTTPVAIYIKLDRCPGEYQFMRDHQLMRGSLMLNGQSVLQGSWRRERGGAAIERPAGRASASWYVKPAADPVSRAQRSGVSGAAVASSCAAVGQ